MDDQQTEPTTSPFPEPRRVWWQRPLPLGLLAGGLAIVVIAAGAVSGSLARTAETPAASAEATIPSAEPTPEVPKRPVPGQTIPAFARTCSVENLIHDPRLGTFQAQVYNADTGEILFERDQDTPRATASSMKILTAAAALNVLGPEYRATTRVVSGPDAGTIVLVGGGDLTLSRLPSGSEPVYTGAAHLDDLAKKVTAARTAAGIREPVRRILLDTTYFGGPTWDPSWPATERRAGWLSHITALQVDADRADPAVFLSPRGEDPVGRAGDAFAAFFPGASTSTGTAAAGATELASVQSAPLSALIPLMLVPSDNTLAEMLGRQVAIKMGAGNTMSAVSLAIPEALKPYGLDTSNLTIADTSGMSPKNAVPPSYLAGLYMKVGAREANLGYIRDGLAVAGQTGTLGYSNRFTGPNAVARGHIWGKTGSITNAYTLGGFIDAADGSTLTFVIYATGRVSESARQGIDTVATGFYRCGNSLSNY
ncbi:D-alanyl-D-alanine carboxypeptidase/D-alanyl-D-alanine-endopeptidase (penicillin-binding protein 4) [Mycetocola sp. BIGb0189]|uniref:D-alanyl-D-alanine carboxypeptidase/D-alanyl-D-alanine endopeptidase n=1 Tax=Mycetocola sp. BIGb0189 TaxID=2940604 RepID=UPI0021674BC6|nr:D-alanyl-D-alanine carboxypeptidase/D-alanyl-D-alanine-endopeptidase [Mycetocola sp. BIGb0189]MCS4276244.1 D-alanyl-D-alanine carboxypeptidase/D-alanyl-D-alanine-endopeptidase (penicillin-binding protein 4) [Mycetocola sp. BIGb0189]